MLIAVLFIQQAVKVSSPSGILNEMYTETAQVLLHLFIKLLFQLQGILGEFRIPEHEDPNLEKYNFQSLYTNGLLGVIFTFGLLYTGLKSRGARSWQYGTGL
jgi:hypothetical protein